MKKAYISPKTEVVNTVLEQMFNSSPYGTNVYEGSADGNKSVLSRDRGNSSYDDDDLW